MWERSGAWHCGPMDAAALIRTSLPDALGEPVAALAPLSGGDTSSAWRVELGSGRTLFVKTHADPPPGFFTTEAAGLRWLGEPGAVPVPAVLAVSDDPPLLALEWVGPSGRARRTSAGEAAFGRGLTALHGAGAAAFGREDRRTTGSLALPNEPARDWPSFYAERRLLPLARIAAERGTLGAGDVRRCESVAARLGGIGAADEPPARLHGDLWAGNRLVDDAGTSWLIDPAAHGGHREFDLAMMRLFGGFDAECFAAYEEASPLAPGWRERVPLHQLAPLLVHAIKFGGGYVGAARDVLRRFAG